MVLVDTSIWIRFLGDRRPWAGELERLLADNRAAGHELVYGELLIGDTGGRTVWLEEYRRIEFVPGARHDEVVAMVRARGLAGRGIGWVDAQLLASAIAAGVRLWTADERLARVAEEAGVGYVMEVV